MAMKLSHFILSALYHSAGFRWLLAEISKDHANLSRRVEKDTAEQVNTLYRGFYKSRQPAKFAIYIKQIDLNSPPTFSEINKIRVKLNFH